MYDPAGRSVSRRRSNDLGHLRDDERAVCLLRGVGRQRGGEEAALLTGVAGWPHGDDLQ